MKKCSACHAIKDLNEFHKKLNGAQGVSGACVPCTKIRRKGYKRTYRSAPGYKSAWYAKNRELCLKKAKEKRAANVEHERARRRAYYKANKAQILETKRLNRLKRTKNNLKPATTVDQFIQLTPGKAA